MESLKCYTVSSLIIGHYFPTAHTECDSEGEEQHILVECKFV